MRELHHQPSWLVTNSGDQLCIYLSNNVLLWHYNGLHSFVIDICTVLYSYVFHSFSSFFQMYTGNIMQIMIQI